MARFSGKETLIQEALINGGMQKALLEVGMLVIFIIYLFTVLIFRIVLLKILVILLRWQSLALLLIAFLIDRNLRIFSKAEIISYIIFIII